MSKKQRLPRALKQIETKLTSMSPEAFIAMLDKRPVGDVGQFYLDTGDGTTLLPVADLTSGSISNDCSPFEGLGLFFGDAEVGQAPPAQDNEGSFNSDDGDFGSEAA